MRTLGALVVRGADEADVRDVVIPLWRVKRVVV